MLPTKCFHKLFVGHVRRHAWLARHATVLEAALFPQDQNRLAPSVPFPRAKRVVESDQGLSHFSVGVFHSSPLFTGHRSFSFFHLPRHRDVNPLRYPDRLFHHPVLAGVVQETPAGFLAGLVKVPDQFDPLAQVIQ